MGGCSPKDDDPRHPRAQASDRQADTVVDGFALLASSKRAARVIMLLVIVFMYVVSLPIIMNATMNYDYGAAFYRPVISQQQNPEARATA